MVSFIIINYRTKELTCDCVKDILENKSLIGIDYEIIVVDNNSGDDSIKYIGEKFPNIKIVESKTNLGFGKGNNIGVENSTGDYLVLLNSDVFIKNTDINLLLSSFEKKGDIGFLGCKVLNQDGTIQSVGYDFPSFLNEIKINILFWNYKFIKNIRYKTYKNKGLFSTDWISGCFMVCKKDTYKSIGGFDESIFMYSEDLDICSRANNLGMRNYVNDEVSVYHLHGKSGNKKSPSLKKLLLNKKPYYYVLIKNNICGCIGFIKLINTVHLIVLCGAKNILSLVK